MTNVTTLQEVELDRRARKYVQDTLLAGGDLSRAVLDRVNTSGVQLRTMLPAGVNPAHAYRFSDAVVSGGRHSDPAQPHPVRLVFDALLDTIDRHLRSFPDAACLLEHIWSSPSDGWLAPFDFVVQQVGVLVFVTPLTDLTSEGRPSLERIVRKASTTIFSCTLVRDADWPQWLKRGEIVTDARIRSAITSPFETILGAYDGEGYVYVDVP